MKKKHLCSLLPLRAPSSPTMAQEGGGDFYALLGVPSNATVRPRPMLPHLIAHRP